MSGSNVLILTGTASEIGEAIFKKCCLPMLRGASNHMGESDLMLLYVGLMGAIQGALAADVGQDKARELVSVMSLSFSTTELEGAKTH